MKEITAKELKEKMDRKETFQLIDVREQYEHEYSNISGELIPMGQIMNEKDKIQSDKPVVIYCRSGNRSAVVIQALEQRFGFTNLYNLKGGILAWAREVDPSVPQY
jgi:rhodanese-related sulfurtransferase